MQHVDITYMKRMILLKYRFENNFIWISK